MRLHRVLWAMSSRLTTSGSRAIRPGGTRERGKDVERASGRRGRSAVRSATSAAPSAGPPVPVTTSAICRPRLARCV